MKFAFDFGGAFRALSRGAIRIRPVAPADRDAIQAFVRALSTESRRRRFFSPIRELSEAALDALARPNPALEKVLVALEGSARDRRIVGLAQFAAAEVPRECEIAVVVADDLHGQGVGARLMEALLAAAWSAGYVRAVGDVLRENWAMIGLARRLGFRVAINAGDSDLLRIALALDETPSRSAAPGRAARVATDAGALGVPSAA